MLIAKISEDLHLALAFCTGKRVCFMDLLDQFDPILFDCRFGAVFEQMLALFNSFDRVLLIMAQHQANGLGSTGMRGIDS